MFRSLDALLQTTGTRLEQAPTGQAGFANEAALETVRQRNAVLDSLFYDVHVVSKPEAQSIGPLLAAEGAILLVPPTDAGRLTLHASIDGFVSAGGTAVRALTVAGVGSSALGSAAFARNVADAIDAPVAAVVSGYGLADVAAEALGGFFWFGALNSIRHSFEWLDRLREVGAIAEPVVKGEHTAASSMRRSKDTRSVGALLSHPDLSFDLLLGHSKGNLVVSEALFGLRATDPKRVQTLREKLSIVTISAKIAMPLGFHVIDVMGQLDGFGELNSRRDIRTNLKVPGAWHHTNTELPWHLPVTKSILQLQAEGRILRAS